VRYLIVRGIGHGVGYTASYIVGKLPTMELVAAWSSTPGPNMNSAQNGFLR
jgi:hypothetical protein